MKKTVTMDFYVGDEVYVAMNRYWLGSGTKFIVVHGIVSEVSIRSVYKNGITENALYVRVEVDKSSIDFNMSKFIIVISDHVFDNEKDAITKASELQREAIKYNEMNTKYQDNLDMWHYTKKCDDNERIGQL